MYVFNRSFSDFRWIPTGLPPKNHFLRLSHTKPGKVIHRTVMEDGNGNGRAGVTGKRRDGRETVDHLRDGAISGSRSTDLNRKKV